MEIIVRPSAYWLARVLNFFLKDTKLMADVAGIKLGLEEANAQLEQANGALQAAAEAHTALLGFHEALDAKLDEVKAFIDTLKAGTVATQQEIDEIAAAVDLAKQSIALVGGQSATLGEGLTAAATKAEALLAEADAADEPSEES